jgi:hypothetical protein
MDGKSNIKERAKKYIWGLVIGIMYYVAGEVSKTIQEKFNMVKDAPSIDYMVKEPPPSVDYIDNEIVEDEPNIKTISALEKKANDINNFSFYDRDNNVIITIFYQKRELERELERKTQEKIIKEKALFNKIKELTIEERLNLNLEVEIKLEKGVTIEHE